jgi:hypothetical protein
MEANHVDVPEQHLDPTILNLETLLVNEEQKAVAHYVETELAKYKAALESGPPLVDPTDQCVSEFDLNNRDVVLLCAIAIIDKKLEELTAMPVDVSPLIDYITSLRNQIIGVLMTREVKYIN